ncbi:MAG: ABC transporter ATP-binding protein, partial [Candidatus Riflemargulisbacteria bacterium]
MLVCSKINKAYGNVLALRDVSISVNSGEIIGLIGADGAGKTSLFRIIVTLLRADNGQVLFDKYDSKKDSNYFRTHLGYMPERFSLYPDLSIEQNMHFFGELFGIDKKLRLERMEQLYKFSGLKKFASRAAGQLSGGMKQKLALSCILMHEPKLLVLDEPTTGVDPISRQEFWELLHQIADNGTGILVSTPYLEEASECDKINIIHNGKILASDNPSSLVSMFKEPLYLITAEEVITCFEQIKKTELATQIQLFGSGIHFIDKKMQGIVGIKKLLKQSKVQFKNIS